MLVSLLYTVPVKSFSSEIAIRRLCMQCEREVILYVVLSLFFGLEDNLLNVCTVDQILEEVVLRFRVMFRKVFNDPGFHH